uniref:Integrase catalytic domain-containing protein n=1 Tax=Amphimedon queenslandica TaxID=400682 RepID=A0A1X7TXP8_AMPQE
MLSTLLSKTIEVLKHLFSRYGLLEQLVSDNGPQFHFDEFHQFIKSSESNIIVRLLTIQPQKEL